MAELINKTDTLNEGREKLNAAITDANRAKWDARTAKTKAEQALLKSESTQTQLNEIVIEGDSSVEAAQARVDEEGKNHATLKERVDDGFMKITTQLAENIEYISSVELSQNDFFHKNFEQFIEHQEVLYSIDLLLENLDDYPQGFSVNQQDNELYIARQINGGTLVRISKYSLPDCSLLETKSFTKSTGAYQEGLPYFHNDLGELCFIVRTTYENNVAIYNFDTGMLGPNIPFKGSVKLGNDIERKFIISHIGDASRTEGVHLYDFQSVVMGSPELIKTIYFDNSITNAEKVQGITIIDDKIVLSHGSSVPAISVIDFNGKTLRSTNINKFSLGNIINEFQDVVSKYDYHNEGVYPYAYNGKVLPLLLHVMDDRIFLTLCGDKQFNKTEVFINERGSNLIEWIDAPLVSGVHHYGNDVKVQYTKDDYGFVYIRGAATHENLGHTPNLTLFTLPYLYRPSRNCFFNTQASGGADRLNRIEISTSGAVTLRATTSISDTPFTVLDGVFFNVN